MFISKSLIPFPVNYVGLHPVLECRVIYCLLNREAKDELFRYDP